MAGILAVKTDFNKSLLGINTRKKAIGNEFVIFFDNSTFLSYSSGNPWQQDFQKYKLFLKSMDLLIRVRSILTLVIIITSVSG